MMLKLWQKKLKLNYSKEVLDIVEFGSSVLSEEPRDIDIAIFFNKIPLKDQLNEAQKIKKQVVEFTDLPVHVSCFDFYSFFDKGNFAKEGILLYGKSLISGKSFSERFGLVSLLQIHYDLKKLQKKDKVKFNYLLSGKGKNYGLLRKYGGKIISPGIVEIFPEFEKIFFNEMSKISEDLKIEKVFKIL